MEFTKIQCEKFYKQPVPPFGHGMLEYFAFDPQYLNFNHGSYGSTPNPVLQFIQETTARIERNPDLFHRLTYQDDLIAVREKLANLIGAKMDEVVLLNNASMGANTVLRNFEWEKDDVLIPFSTTYGSVFSTVESISDVGPHPKTATFVLKFPTTHSDILTSFHAHLKAHPVGKNNKRVAIIDSIVSVPGMYLPWKEIVAICREEGVWSVVDAAHSIGQEVGINLEEAQPDFWFSNCHKWLYAKRPCAVLYVPERNQHIIKTSIPTSHAYKSPDERTSSTFVDQFEWNGTIDFTSYLSVVPALEFRAWLGGEEKINAYCHDLAIKGGKRLAELFGTRVMDSDGKFTLNMANVELPFPGSVKCIHAVNSKFTNKMLREQKMYSVHYYHNEAWWTRCCVQVWHELEDFDKIGKAWVEVCNATLKEIQGGEVEGDVDS
ncbi:uncharacterized protein LACBIDRAFT_298401 [Laccaria bicolor S238N-H82]|uniref:Predicted protein n=1 Tax=Laccaria bicolor (strain S238N-H82 / ATCC MYA-4686) TaxID=486041 RepID=B0DCR8_LACBS|nr:uncharacterized protein LACBIDRAFT_298401 [Laccaria bicolor S238N-H82]EDR07491.1 predicted protein [Laccaria bicolor S238N-H82]|eukprot:XP_001881883.1 predicted protein [Laccaria bicolor S238N-H82]